jgi:RNA polymerase sigma factor (sigma-70 family)
MNSSETESLETLLERSRSGDPESRALFFAALLAGGRQRAVLYAMARRSLGRSDQARRLIDTEDVVQGGLSTGLDRFADFRGESLGAFFGWMRAILRSEVNRVMRRECQCLEPKRLEPCRFRGERGECEAFSSGVRQEEAREKLREALAALPRDDRRILELQLSGWNAKQIGRIMALKPAAVRKRRSRALRKLRTILERPPIRPAPVLRGRLARSG